MAPAARPGFKEEPQAMKKLFATALLSLAAIAFVTQPASAWLFCHKCCTRSTCRIKVCSHQENAFSPFCVDSVRYRGCGCHQFNGVQPGCDNGYAANGCEEGASGQLPAAAPAQGAAQGHSAYLAPMPNMMTPNYPMPNGMMMAPAPGMAATGYQPGYAPYYYPANGAYGQR
jgi:hypothetical protein